MIMLAQFLGHLECAKFKKSQNLLILLFVKFVTGYIFFRVIQEDWEAGVPRTRQCWKNNTPAHAQR